MKILIIDDDKLVSGALSTIIGAAEDTSVVATGSSGEAAIALYDETAPDVVLMDIRMGEMTGIEAAKRILEKDKEAKILFLTTFTDGEYVTEAITCGAKGYILKQDYENIVPALRAVYLGQTVFGSDIVKSLPELLKGGKNYDYGAKGISERELEVLELVSEGQSNKEIAESLYLSEGTVRNYISSLLDKLELRDRTQLAVFYLKNS
ncbi:DNA-binding NarL/FixJ family response regulator [Lachnospiraceae bacterium PF1-21]|uniref:Stage 0 sporulation protein A homolog n=1 Tax=Ohessyouella blattaphilus TaxID=2949333 RepID=A0ABT1EF10_9FIRM|nr:response regulator transcription factor [Ohessyouella blattaphilus]MCP1109270.1 response regulator transcription factor [Ohessyouella blattaphilus]MCR8562664.1 response regulator transcription factor [Ohessyouella blattaphilus]MDL2251006.1 response regulator transcription factor [Lachnospiraceae bacterium OttesenSCG-928-J05]